GGTAPPAAGHSHWTGERACALSPPSCVREEEGTMVPVEIRQQAHLSFTQIDQYLRCPLKYKFTYVDRLEPAFLPVALAFGSGIHGAAAFFYRSVAKGERPSVADVQGYFAALWKLESEHRRLRFGERETKESLLDLAQRMLAVLVEQQAPAAEVVAV